MDNLHILDDAGDLIGFHDVEQHANVYLMKEFVLKRLKSEPEFVNV